MNTIFGEARPIGAIAGALLLFGVIWFGTDGALASDGIAVKITNDTSADVVVTLIDMNAKPEQTLLSNETIYGFASRPVRIAPDDSGYGHIRWTATSGSASSRTCGHAERSALSADGVIHVSANTGCGAT
jgi:hypothetical protein